MGEAVNPGRERGGVAKVDGVDRGAIVVFRIGQLGDTLMSLPALKAIRHAHPRAALFLLTDRHEGTGYVSPWEILEPMGWFAGVFYFSPGMKVTALLGLARKLRALAPRVLYYLPPIPRTSRQVSRDWLFFRLLCGIRGFGGLRPTGRYPIRRADGSLPRVRRESDRLLEWIAKDLPGADAGRHDREIRISPPREHQREVAATLSRGGFAERPLVAFGPGSKRASTRWPAQRFVTVGRVLLQRFPDIGIVVLGNGADAPLGDELCAVWGDRSLNLAGKLGVWGSAALLGHCRLYIGNDTGTTHLAASAGTPCVAIFGGRDNPGKWEPAGSRDVVLRREVSCAGCMLDACTENGLVCLRAITVEQVVDAAAALLERQDMGASERSGQFDLYEAKGGDGIIAVTRR